MHPHGPGQRPPRKGRQAARAALRLRALAVSPFPNCAAIGEKGLSAAAPGLPALAWTATKSGCLWRTHRGAKRLRGLILLIRQELARQHHIHAVALGVGLALDIHAEV